MDIGKFTDTQVQKRYQAQPTIRPPLEPLFSSHQVLEGVDWSRTKAFALGLTGLFINRKGREKCGIVEEGLEYQKLVQEIADKLGKRNAEETLLKTIIIKGVMSIQSGDNPRVVEQKLKTFLPPAQRELEPQTEGG